MQFVLEVNKILKKGGSGPPPGSAPVIQFSLVWKFNHSIGYYMQGNDGK